MAPELFSNSAPNDPNHAKHSEYLPTQPKHAHKYPWQKGNLYTARLYPAHDKAEPRVLTQTKHASGYKSYTIRPKRELAHQVSRNFDWLWLLKTFDLA